MSTIIEFKNMNFGYNNTNTFNDFNMEIESGDIISLIGPSGSGKTTLLKMLCHSLPNEWCYFEGNKFSDYSPEELKKDIIVIFDKPFTQKGVKEEITKFLQYLGFSEEEIEDRYDVIRVMFKIDKFDGTYLQNLSHSQKYLIKILRYLIIQPKFVAIDNLLVNLNKQDKDQIIEYIKTYNMTLLNVTTDLDETLYGNKICVLENFVLILEGSTLTVLQTDTLLKRLGFKIPLPVDLSIELNNYEVLDKIYTDKDKLVNALWK